jgi:hypothetical protein
VGAATGVEVAGGGAATGAAAPELVVPPAVVVPPDVVVELLEGVLVVALPGLVGAVTAPGVVLAAPAVAVAVLETLEPSPPHPASARKLAASAHGGRLILRRNVMWSLVSRFGR